MYKDRKPAVNELQNFRGNINKVTLKSWQMFEHIDIKHGYERVRHRAEILFETRQIFGTSFHLSSSDGENFFRSADLCSLTTHTHTLSVMSSLSCDVCVLQVHSHEALLALESFPGGGREESLRFMILKHTEDTHRWSSHV